MAIRGRLSTSGTAETALPLKPEYADAEEALASLDAVRALAKKK